MIKYVELTAPEASAYRQAKIISIECNEGDYVKAGDTLFMVQSGNTKLELPSTKDGRVVEFIVSEQESITLSTALLLLETEVESSTATPPLSQETESTAQKQVVGLNNRVSAAHNEQQSLNLLTGPADVNEESRVVTPSSDQEKKPPIEINENNSMSETTLLTINVPDIGADSAKVIEILVSVGDQVTTEDALVTLESDKASMDVPSTTAGTVKSIDVNVDDDVSEGTVVVTIEPSASLTQPSASLTQPSASKAQPSSDKTESSAIEASSPVKPAQSTSAIPSAATPADVQTPTPSSESAQDAHANSTPNVKTSHASPSIRRFARELGVNLSKVNGTGRKNRVTKNDVKGFVKGALDTTETSSTTSPPADAAIPPIPAQDFTKFGDIEITPLNKIKRLTANNLHRSWLNVPHVTHNDESNINDLESFRKQLNTEYKAQDRGIKLSPLAFIVKAVVNALQAYPQFNSSLDIGGENLILKKYFHIGIAVETPNGLVVPVVRDADTKSVAQIAKEMGELASKARDKKLTMNDMSGACFTISSLGGIGGTSFTPIVNAPEVAILGVSRSKIQPVWNGEKFNPGMMLPISLSYDHRVIDGAEAARFTRHIAAALEDVRRLAI